MRSVASTSISARNTRFKGIREERDVESQYDYFDARYYDARIGRFLGVDRYSAKYPSLSPYSYAANNPLRYLDCDGDSLELLGQHSREALKLIKEKAAEYASRVSTVNGFVQVDQKGYKKGENAFIDNLIELSEAEQKVGFEVTSEMEELKIGIRAKDGEPMVVGGAFSQVSKTPRSPGQAPEKVPDGYTGYITLHNQVEWFHDDGVRRVSLSEIAGHEIVEANKRNVGGKSWEEAHNMANKVSYGGTGSDPAFPKPPKR